MDLIFGYENHYLGLGMELMKLIRDYTAIFLDNRLCTCLYLVII